MTFPTNAPSANPVFYRTYSRRTANGRETWEEVCDRTLKGLVKVGHLTKEEADLIDRQQRSLHTLSSGRWLWVGGTEWVEKEENFSGAYNCSSSEVIDWASFGLMMSLAMMGVGTGANLEQRNVEKLPPICNTLDVSIVRDIGAVAPEDRLELTSVVLGKNEVFITVGDSRQGWVDSYQTLLELSSDWNFDGQIKVSIDLGNVRPAGEPLNGFGGVSNPIKLPELYPRIANILNKAIGRKLTSVECCLLIDEAAIVVVAGNIRRCLPEDALVHTINGLVPIKNIEVGDLVQTPIGFRRVVNKFDQGIQDVYEVSTDWTPARATLKHRMAIVTENGGIEWKRVKDLKEGNLLSHIDRASVKVLSVGSPVSMQTYDIEVEEAHCFYADGYLTHNSAGIRQFSSDDEAATIAKQNLWQQDEDGTWHIDPDRDALRMANHTRVFHQKPSLEEVIEAVRKQFYSGEGAIQYAPEAIARANADILDRPELKEAFLSVYEREGREAAKLWLKTYGGISDENELEHRLHRYGMNPCLRGDMLVMTQHRGWMPIEKLVGQTVNIQTGGDFYSPAKFFHSGKKTIVKMVMDNGQELFCTPDHRWMGAYGEEIKAIESKGFQIRGTKRASTVLDVIEVPGECDVYDFSEPVTHWGVVEGFYCHNCGEIIGSDFHCDLGEIHLNTIDPQDEKQQEEAFRAAAINVATLLNHKFVVPRYQQSREWDPIVGVSFTGLFDFFVNAFGVEWLQWWEAGRPKWWGLRGKTTKHYASDYFTTKEKEYLSKWRSIVEQAVWEYCDRHGLRRPNRCTTVQPSGSKSLLTGASPGWHPPKAQRFIRRVTFRKDDPVAMACLDYGYSIVPSQSDKDETGRLLDDPFDPRCTEWLVEIPTEVSWANLEGADTIDISQFSATAQFDFYMQVQKHYVRHNSSATIEFREYEIDSLADRIYNAIQNNDGYISAALLARFDDRQTFPRLPFEPIDKETYDRLQAEVLARRKTDDFLEALRRYDRGDSSEVGPAGCDSDKCLLPERK